MIYTAAAIWQSYTAHKQLRIEQRPWVEVTTKVDVPFTILINSPLSIPLRLINLGKTPAESLSTSIAVRLVSSGDEPFIPSFQFIAPGFPITPPGPTGKSFIYPVMNFYDAMLYPQAPDDFKAIRMRVVQGHDDQVEPELFTFQEAMALKDKKSYVVVFGTVFYRDVWDTIHRTQFCSAQFTDGTPAGSHKCADYNGVDNN